MFGSSPRRGGGSRTVADVVEDIGYGPSQLRTNILVNGSWLADGAEIFMISATTSAIAKEWDISGISIGLITSVVYTGTFLGNLISGILGDSWGRRFPVVICFPVICLCTIASSLAQEFWQLLILRFLVGFGFGVGQPSAVALLMEVSPAKWRCLNQGLAQIAFAIGELYCCMLLWLDDPSLENLRWRKLLVSAAGPALLFALLSWAFLGESPAHLESKGDLVGAEDVLDKMRRSNGQYHVDVSIELPRGNHSGAPTSKSPETAGGLQLHTICSGRLGMTTATLCFICFCYNLSVYGAFNAFPSLVPKLMTPIAGGSPVVALASGALLEIPCDLIGLWAGVCLPRKVVLYIYFAGIALSSALFAGGGSFSTWSSSALWLGYYGIKGFPQIGSISLYTFAAESYPVAARATGTAVVIGVGRIGAVLAPLVYQGLHDATGSHQAFFILVAALAAFSFGATWSWTLETYCGRAMAL